MRQIVRAMNCPCDELSIRRIVRATNCPGAEKMLDLDGVYNSENDRIWTVNREEANRRGEKQQGKFTEKVMYG